MESRLKFRQALYKGGKFQRFFFWGYHVKKHTTFTAPMFDHADQSKGLATSNSEQCLGWKDKEGEFIYQNDILEDPNGHKTIMVWFDDNLEFVEVDLEEYNMGNEFEPAYISDTNYSMNQKKIVGSIHSEE